jgi:hypothetical protein
MVHGWCWRVPDLIRQCVGGDWWDTSVYDKNVGGLAMSIGGWVTNDKIGFWMPNNEVCSTEPASVNFQSVSVCQVITSPKGDSMLSGTAVLVISPGLNINCPQWINFMWKYFCQKTECWRTKDKRQRMKWDFEYNWNITMMWGSVVLLVMCFSVPSGGLCGSVIKKHHIVDHWFRELEIFRTLKLQPQLQLHFSQLVTESLLCPLSVKIFLWPDMSLRRWRGIWKEGLLVFWRKMWLMHWQQGWWGLWYVTVLYSVLLGDRVWHFGICAGSSFGHFGSQCFLGWGTDTSLYIFGLLYWVEHSNQVGVLVQGLQFCHGIRGSFCSSRWYDG